MEGNSFDHIDTLEKSRTDWRIKVRVTRFWPTYSPESASVKGYNLILLDDDNTHVHAYVYPDNWLTIGKEVVEGSVYIFENFQVRDTIGRLKPVSTKICLRLLGSTNIEYVENDPMIPLNKFEFMDLADLFEEASRQSNDENPEFSIDVLGVFEDFEKVKRITTKFGERDIVRFRITDGSVTHKVSVWGDLASSVSDMYYQQDLKPIIGIISSTKVTIFKNSVQIAALPSSKIYLNLNIEPVAEMRSRLEEEGYKSGEGSCEIVKVVPARSTLHKITFKDLIENPIHLLSKRNVLVSFKITKMEDEDNWWYNGCNVCHAEVEKIEKKFKCLNCNRSFPYCEKRFRILVLADDNTFKANVILMDRVVKRLVCNTATNILNEKKEPVGSNAIPDVLKKFIGKDITVKLSLSEANVAGDSNIYEAVDLCDSYVPTTTTTDHSPIPKCPSFDQPSVLHGIELFETPGSSKSVTKKIKTEEI